MLSTCWTMRSHLFFAGNLASKLIVSIWKSGSKIWPVERVSSPGLIVSYILYRLVRLLRPSFGGSCTKHVNNMFTMSSFSTCRYVKDRLHAGALGLSGAWMIDYKITATSLKAKQGLWRLMGASCSLLQRKKIRQREGSLRMTPALWRPGQSH